MSHIMYSEEGEEIQPCRHCEDAFVDEYIRTNRWSYRVDAQKYHSEEVCPTLNRMNLRKSEKKGSGGYEPSSSVESPKSKGSSHFTMPVVHGASQGNKLFKDPSKQESKQHSGQTTDAYANGVHQPRLHGEKHSHGGGDTCLNKNHRHIYDPNVISDCHADHWCTEHEWHKDHDYCVRVEDETYKNHWFRELFTLRE